MDQGELRKKLEALPEAERGKLLAYFAAELPRGDQRFEAFQELIVRAYSLCERYREQGSFEAWLWAIAANVVLEMRRKKRRRDRRFTTASARFEETPRQPIARGSLPRESAEEGERLERIRRALDQLSGDERLAIELNVFRGLTQPEIAEALGWSVAKVKNLAAFGREKLAAFLRDVEL